MHCRLTALISLFVCSSLFWCLIIQAAEFHGLGDLPGGQSDSSAWAISSDGLTVVGTASSAARPESGFNEAYVWTPETDLVGLGFQSLQDNYSTGRGVSADGNTVVGAGSLSGNVTAFRWTRDEGMQSLGVVDGDVARQSYAEAVSQDGSVIAGLAILSGAYPERAFVWTEESGMSYLPPVPWMGERQKLWARDMSIDGTVIAGNSENGNSSWGDEGFLWSAENGYTHIEPQGEIVTTHIRAVSDDGTTVVGGLNYIVDDRVPGGAMWWRQDVGVVDVGGLPDNTPLGAHFYDISGNGKVAVGQDWLVNGVHPIIWDEIYGVRNIEQLLREDFGIAEALEGWRLERALAVSRDGLTIVGGGVNPQGKREAWRVALDETPPPVLVPGDANLDGHVNFADFLSLSSNFDRGAFWYQGDFDGNYQINMVDFHILREHFGRKTPVVAVSEPVPSVLVFVAAGLLLPLILRRRM